MQFIHPGKGHGKLVQFLTLLSFCTKCKNDQILEHLTKPYLLCSLFSVQSAKIPLMVHQ